MEIYIKLFLAALLPAALAIAFTFLKKLAFFRKLPYMAEQAVIGTAFGLAAVLATEHGVNLGAATANARDAAPLCAGLIFGAPAGIIAGLIGGIERWFAALWGAGMYSRLACTVSTILAGFLAAFLRRFMFDDRRPNWEIGLFTGIVMEVIHLTILFMTHLQDAENAYEIVKIVTLPMVFCNSIGVAIGILGTRFMEKEGPEKRSKGSISSFMQRGLLALVLLAYLFTTVFVFYLQTQSAEADAEAVIRAGVDDFKEEMELLTDEEINALIPKRHLGSNGYLIIKSDDFIATGKENVISEFGYVILQEDAVGKLIRGTDPRGKIFALVTELRGYKIIGVLRKEEVYSARDRMAYINSYMEIIVFAFLFAMVYFLVKRLVTDNVHAVNKSLGRIIDGDLNEVVRVRATEEFASLSDDINSTVETLKRYIDAEKARIDRELQYAKEIQYSALPSVFPDQKEFAIFASMDTAKEVGGDFYDFYLLGDDRLAFLVADVSGKGVPAALFMMQAKTMLKNLTEAGQPVNKVFHNANMKLLESNETGMFVTAWMGILELRTGHVTFCNAGHNPPLIAGRSEDFDYHRSRANLVLAGMEDAPYKLQEMYLAPGDRIFLYTDGVTEATDSADRLYGEERLKDCLNREKALSPEKMALAVRRDVDAFVGEREQFDDITMLILQYNGPEEETDAGKA